MSSFPEAFNFNHEEAELIERALSEKLAKSCGNGLIGNDDRMLISTQLMGVLANLYNQRLWHLRAQQPVAPVLWPVNRISFDCWL